MKASTLVKATMSYKLGQVKAYKAKDGVYVTAINPKDPITCSDIVTAASVIGMIVYFIPEALVAGKQTPALFIGDQCEQKKTQP